MLLTKDQLDAVLRGGSVRLQEAGADLIVLRADLFEQIEGASGTALLREARWRHWFEKLAACRSVKDGWNGYTAKSPNEKSLENAQLFLQEMQLEAIEPTRVAPSAMGGVAITRRVGNRKVFVEFYNDGRIYSLFSEKSDEMQVQPVEANPLGFRALISNLRDYLNVECAA